MSRFVVALDPVVSGVSVALVAEDAPTPVTKYVFAPGLRAPITSTSHLHRTRVTADRALESVFKNGVPAAVVLPQCRIGTPRDDQSGPQRAQLYGELTRRLTEAGIPIIEIPPMTVMKWLLERFVGGKAGHVALEKAVQDTWPNMSAPESTKYRWSTVALAAAGCMGAGIPTKVAVTNDRLATLTAARLPGGWTLPVSEKGWPVRNYEKPVMTEEVVEDDEQTEQEGEVA